MLSTTWTGLDAQRYAKGGFDPRLLGRVVVESDFIGAPSFLFKGVVHAWVGLVVWPEMFQVAQPSESEAQLAAGVRSIYTGMGWEQRVEQLDPSAPVRTGGSAMRASWRYTQFAVAGVVRSVFRELDDASGREERFRQAATWWDLAAEDAKLEFCGDLEFAQSTTPYEQSIYLEYVSRALSSRLIAEPRDAWPCAAARVPDVAWGPQHWLRERRALRAIAIDENRRDSIEDLRALTREQSDRNWGHETGLGTGDTPPSVRLLLRCGVLDLCRHGDLDWRRGLVETLA